jgi:hypothetical protein
LATDGVLAKDSLFGLVARERTQGLGANVAERSRRIEQGGDSDVVRRFYDSREVIAAHRAIDILDLRADFLALLAERVLPLERVPNAADSLVGEVS